MLLVLFACDPGTERVAKPGDAPGETAAPPPDTAPPADSGDTAPHDTAPIDDTGTSCQPKSCTELGAECGTVDDGCGTPLPCGTCGAWESCSENVCETAACVPTEGTGTDGGGRCGDLAQAWTARGINVGYYPFKVLQDTYQYSGDYGGSGASTFEAGGTTKGVILQVIPAGSYVGLSSTGPYYETAEECSTSTCGDADADACTESTPPLRAGIAGFYWGYAYSGASHMQGWIYADPTHLEYVGGDASHPCATGPAGADYEVAEACGAATTCAGTNRTCGDANPCDEGSDDCGRETCGAESGGALTPSAHRATVTLPSEAVACTEATPPDSRVLCLPNGSDIDFFFVYPFGAYVYWAQNSTTKHWLHYGDEVQMYYHTRDAQGVLWDFVEVLSSGAPVLTPASDGAGAGSGCSSSTPEGCTPCQNGGTCGWIQDVFLE